MERPRLTTDDIAHMAEGNSPATVALDYDEACTAMAQELLAIRRASQAAPSDGLREAAQNLRALDADDDEVIVSRAAYRRLRDALKASPAQEPKA